MKTLQTLFVGLAVFMITSPPSRADDKVVRQQLDAEYLKADAATRARDLDRVMNHYTTDFTLKIGSKSFDRKQVANMMHWQIVATKEVKSISFTIQALVVKGDTAIATVKQDETLLVYKDKTPYLLVSSQVSEDTWISTPSGWRLKHQAVKHNVITRDGKPIQQVSYVPHNFGRCFRAA